MQISSRGKLCEPSFFYCQRSEIKTPHIMDSTYETNHRLQHHLYIRTIIPSLQICTSESSENHPRSLYPPKAQICSDIPWSWLIGLFILHWLVSFACYYFYTLIRSTFQQFSNHKNGVIKVLFPDTRATPKPQARSLRHGVGPETNPFLRPIRPKKTLPFTQRRPPGYLPGHIPEH